MIRRPVRNAIKRGSTVYAIVELCEFGRATVRLTDSGMRLTNLSTVGGVVVPGQKVTVDYSAGTNPVVRPLFIDQGTELEPIIMDKPEQQMFTNDYGCLGWRMGYSLDPMYIRHGQEFLVPFGFNKVNEEWYGGAWDYPDCIDFTTNPGREYIEVPKTGKYIISIDWDEYLSNFGTGAGYVRLRVLCNGSPIGCWYGRNGEGYGNQMGLSFTVIDRLSENDQIAFEIFQTVGDIALQWYGGHDYKSLSIALQYIPGSE